MILRCPQCDSSILTAPEDSCKSHLDRFLKTLHEELQQDDKTVFMLDLGTLGRISLHWNS